MTYIRIDDRDIGFPFIQETRQSIALGFRRRARAARDLSVDQPLMPLLVPE